MMPPTLERYTLVRSDGIHGLGTSALPPRIEPRRPRIERVCLRLLWCALRFFLLLCLRARLEPARLRLWCALRLALVCLPLRECLRLDLLVTGILRGIVYAEIITKTIYWRDARYYSTSTCVNIWRRQHIFVSPSSSRTSPSGVFAVFSLVK
jgi:hypothetical protein